MRRTLILAVLTAACASVAQAQTWTPYPGATVADRHRHEMERLRSQSDAQAAFARRQALGARPTVLELQAARQPALADPYAPRLLRSPEAERDARERATTRREAITSGVTQIDAWLDRPSQ